MRKWLLLLITLSACHSAPRNESQITKDQGIASAPNAVIASYDGPFGIAKGEPLSALNKGQEEKPGYYKINSVPQPYPNIEYYVVENTPEHGTCMVKAISNDIDSDSFGNRLKENIDHVRDDLQTRYGLPSDSYDFLHSGSIWSDPQDWMMSLTKNERNYFFIWTAPKNADQRIWRGVETVGLTAGANGSKGWFTIEYDFIGGKQCDDDLKKKAAKSL